MGILQRHVSKEILIPFLLAFTILTFLVVVGNLLQEITRQFANKGLAFADMAMLIMYALPTLVIYTIPIALLFATLIAFAQLSQDCEIIAMKSAGIPIRKIFVPAIAIGLLATLFLLFLNAEVSPRARRKLKTFIIEKVLEKPTLVLSEQAWTREMNDMRIFVGKIDDKRMLLEDIDIVISGRGPRRNIVAESGQIYVNETKDKVFLELKNGVIHEYDIKKPDTYSTTTFRRLNIPVNIEAVNKYIEKYDSLGSARKKEMTFRQIVQRIGDASVGEAQRQSLFRYLSEQIALAFMPLAFALISAPLGIIPHKARRMYGFAVCGGLLLAYYSLLILAEALAKKGMLNPPLAMWIPNLFLGAMGFFYMIRAEKK